MTKEDLRCVVDATEFAGEGAYLLPLQEEPGEGWYAYLVAQSAQMYPQTCDGDSAGCQWRYGPHDNPCICVNPGHQVDVFADPGRTGALLHDYNVLWKAAHSCRNDPFGPHQAFARLVQSTHRS